MAEGRCNCGSITVSMPSMPEQSAICYCPQVTINDPNKYLKDYRDNDTKSGNPITRQFCSNCGCPITSVLAGDKIALKGGLFDKIPAPGFKSFEQEEPSWMKTV
ncbi:hypothetical protein J4E89_000786 [Alternaria sp. Ai002NY15]|nr:hypothetical protein J4E89_000786 [Alternaria sp. Ai002NY15]